MELLNGSIAQDLDHARADLFSAFHQRFLFLFLCLARIPLLAAVPIYGWE
jgi:hypothetical protein